MPAPVEIYTRAMCGYCYRAVRLLEDKGADFLEIDAGMDAGKKREMIQRTRGAATFPQIFIGGKHVGGCDDMLRLERRGALDGMLKEAGAI